AKDVGFDTLGLSELSNFRATVVYGDTTGFYLTNGDTVKYTAELALERAPKLGDVYEIRTSGEFNEVVYAGEDKYEFSTKGHHVDSDELKMERIMVVPNPYVVTSQFERYVGSGSWNRKEIRFINLPEECTIEIYTLTGDRVKTIDHQSYSGGFNPPLGVTWAEHIARYPSGIGEARWDLITEENLEVSYGMYIYVVKTPDGLKHIGKMAIIK
ncbi:hypothetical protein ACFL5P_02870, partial [candidate division KSB1 bacterium]